jgi:thiamine kinase-like enzyme
MSLNTKLTLAAHGIDVNSVVSKTRGGNSVIYKCKKTDGSYIGVKEYLGDAPRRARSMEREVESLNFLVKHDFKYTSKLISFNKSKPSICYEWIDGTIPENNKYIKNKIEETLVSLKSLYDVDPNFPLAVDAVSSLDTLNKQIAARIDVAKANLINYPEILQLIQKAHESKKSNSFLIDTFPINTYSFSDIGTHNMLVNSDGKVYFLDFEFFGADSKIKMIADIFSHPQTIFAKEEIVSLAIKLSLSDNEFQQLMNVIPRIAIKWALITSRRLSEQILIDHGSVNQILEQIRNFLEYSHYLREISEIGMILTFPEFQRMQQYKA